MDDDREVQSVREFQLADEELNLRIFVAEFSVVVEARFTDSDYSRFSRSFNDPFFPAPSGICHFTR